jgi:hypothetical protein
MPFLPISAMILLSAALVGVPGAIGYGVRELREAD